jgi:hypothetical protein
MRKNPEVGTKLPQSGHKPLLLVDVDGVISLFGFSSGGTPKGRWMNVDGILHLISATAGEHLHALARSFDLAWCTGWEDKANEHLVPALALPGPLPVVALTAHDEPPQPAAHWKLAAVQEHAARRPVAWIDDSFNDACREWASARPEPTLLVDADPPVGLTVEHVTALERWAAALAR